MRTIKNLSIPAKLEELIENQGLDDELLIGVDQVFPALEDPLVFLRTFDGIKSVSEDRSLLNEKVLGIKSSLDEGSTVELPFLDYDNAIFFAVNKYPGDDVAIVLDYRNSSQFPNVVTSAFKSGCIPGEWEVISNSFEHFWSMISNRS